MQTGRLFPDPVTGCFFVWSAWFYSESVHRQSRKWMFATGLALTMALFVRSQLFHYFLVLVPLALILSAPLWFRDPKSRGLAASFVLGCLPLVVVWLSIVRVVGDDLSEIEAFGNFTFQQRYPYGFWQFLDSDGWMGPYRLGKEPYYQALEVEAEASPELGTSYSRQLLFTARYVYSRAGESVVMVLDNVYRLYDRPANDYKWDYPFPYRYQVTFQKSILVFSLAGMGVLISTAPKYAGVFFVPFCLALLHGLSYPWPRFNQPAMPILIASAGVFLTWGVGKCVSLWKTRKSGLTPVAFAVMVAVFLFGAGELFRLNLPDVFRPTGWLARLALVSIPFLLVALPFEHGRRRQILLVVSIWLGLTMLISAHTLRDQLWHQVRIEIDSATPGVEQEITLSAEALARLRNASEAFLVFDLHIPKGTPRGLTVEINGTPLPSSRLVPTMPRFGESTAAGGRDRRGYPQWWAVRLDQELLPKSAPAVFRVRLRVAEGTRLILYGDRFRNQDRWYEGPSFGDWPHLAAAKLEYDGDYRLPIRLPLRSARTKSFILDATGQPVATPIAHRIRIITLSSNQGRLEWETAAVPQGERLGLGFFAYSGKEGRAELLVGGKPVFELFLGSKEDVDLERPPERLCFRAEAPRGDMAYGGYLLIIPRPESRERLKVEVRFRSGMSIERRFFSLDLGRNADDLTDLAARCNIPRDVALMNGAARIVDASSNSYPQDTGRWSVASVF